MRSPAAFCAFFSLAALLGVACGGIDEPDLFTSGGATSSGDAGGVAKDGGSRDASGGGGDGGGGRDSGGGVDSGGGGKDAGGGSDPGIFCGNGSSGATECTGTNICCARNNTLGAGLATFSCGAEEACTGDALGDLIISCDDAHDCGGDICCGTIVTGTSSSYYTDVSCQTTCDGSDERVFCDPAKGNEDCGGTGTCGASTSMPGYHVCQ